MAARLSAHARAYTVIHADTCTCNTGTHTLHVVLSVEMRTFLAARSRWTNPLVDRYNIPKATCRLKLRRVGLSSEGTPFFELKYGKGSIVLRCTY